jgi:hypothetical protein
MLAALISALQGTVRVANGYYSSGLAAQPLPCRPVPFTKLIAMAGGEAS